MAKQTQQFTFTTPIMWGNKDPQRVELEISGVGYYYRDNEPGEEYEFDIDCVKAGGHDFTNIFRVLQSDQDSRVEQTINEATMAHMAYIFSGECGMCERSTPSYGAVMLAKMEDGVTIVEVA